MNRIFKLLFIFISILLIGGISTNDKKHLDKLLSSFIPTPTSQILGTTTQKDEYITVKRVIDGDTIELTDGRKVRYIGINSPESVDPRRAVQCFGKEASEKNKELVEGKEVRMQKDVSETDKYGRLLRYVYIKEGNEEIFVNEYLVKEGYALSSAYPPDIAYQDIFKNAEHSAQENKSGLWNSCK